MPTCLHCSARIPGGRTYCHPHYQEALRHHSEQLVAFQEAMDRWSRLSPAARALKDDEAEDDELCIMATLIALFAGGYLWYQVNALLPIDGLWGVGIMLATGWVMVGWTPARYLVGKLGRAAYVALPLLLYGIFGLGALCLISSSIRAHSLPLFFITVTAVLVYSLIREWSGQHQASGIPALPLEPRP